MRNVCRQRCAEASAHLPDPLPAPADRASPRRTPPAHETFSCSLARKQRQVQGTDLPAVLATAELAALAVARVEVAPDHSLVELAARNVAHAGQSLVVRVVLDEAEATGRPEQTQTEGKRSEAVLVGEEGEVREGTHLLCRSRPMMIRFSPPPVSGLLHLLNTVASQRDRFC